VRALSLLWLATVGCAAEPTTLAVHVSAEPGVVLAAVDVSVFDAHGLLGRTTSRRPRCPAR